MAMNNQLLAVVQHIESERGVSREIVLTAIEQAISQAARKNQSVTNDLRVAIDRKDLSLHVYDTLVVSDEETGPGFISSARAVRFNHGNPVQEGDAIEIEMPASRLGRIAAQTSRQMIMQKIREAERTNTFAEYKDRVGDIVSGTVSAVSHRDTYVTVGKTEMILPGKERIPTEDYQVGDTIRAIILRVDPEAKGPNVILARASGKFVEALFRLEVSEIADGIVEIMGVSRDPGYRAKLAEVKKSMATASFEDQKAEAIKELAEMFSVSTAVATQMADAGYLTVDGIAEEDEASFIAATGLDEVAAKGIYAAAKAVAELTSQNKE